VSWVLGSLIGLLVHSTFQSLMRHVQA
jgi:hypothetical protein